MLIVSNDWKNMFNKTLVSEALIKFVVEDYGTLYKEDIFSYTFNGIANGVANRYPQYEAQLELVMRNDYNNFGNFLHKKVEIYYGFVINGTEEYHKAQTLFIDDIEISDNGRVCSWTLKSSFNYLTTTIHKYPLYYQDAEDYVLHFYNNYTDFLDDILGDNSIPYDDINLYCNYDIRFLPSKITRGEALQQLTFVNCASLGMNEDGDIIINGIYTNAESFASLNLTTYLHIEKMEDPPKVSAFWFDINNTNKDENQSYGVLCNGHITPRHIPPSSPILVGENIYDLDNKTMFIQEALWDISASSSAWSGRKPQLTYYNDTLRVWCYLTAGMTEFDYTIRGFNFGNYVETDVQHTTIFDININNQEHCDLLGARIEDYLTPQKVCEMNCRFDPRFELLDTIQLDNEFKYILIEELKITFRGSYQARIRGRYNDNSVARPIILQRTYNVSGQFTLVIRNPNPFPCNLYVEYSGGTLLYSMLGGATITLDETNASALCNSVIAYCQQDLQDDIYCYFEDEYFENYYSYNVMIWEENT